MCKQMISKILTASLLAACGNIEALKEKDDEDSSEQSSQSATSADTNETLLDTTLAGAVISSQMDDATAAISESPFYYDSSSLLLMKGKRAKPSKRVSKDRDQQRTCEENAQTGEATVKISHEFSKSKEQKSSKKLIKQTLEVSMLKTRLWKKDGEAIKCAENKKHIAFKDLNLANALLNVTLDHTHNHQFSYTNLETGEIKSRSRFIEAKGTRVIKWLKDQTENNIRTVEKSVTSSVIRKMEVENSNGKTRSLEKSIDIKEDAPLLVEDVRDLANKVWKSKLIKSGKVISVASEGSKFETMFDNVKYQYATACLPVSGTINGKIYENKDAVEPKRTYQIVFSGDSAKIIFGDGKEEVFTLEGCALDEEINNENVDE